jgi:predicted alpha-1,6-mannanase (GH76 family)
MKNVMKSAMRILKKIDMVMGGRGRINLSVCFVLLLCFGAGSFAQAQVADERAENVQNGLKNIFMSADQSYYKFNSTADNDPYVYGYWVTAHALETLADAYQRTRNVVYYNRMKSILAGIRKYNLYGAGTYHNDYYDDLEWLCLAALNCYYATKDPEFLDAVHQIWAEIKTGYSGGKMSWKKGCTTPCNNSIGNSPAIVIAVRLYKLENDNANLQMAKDIHAWMKANVFNANGGIWDAPGNFDEGWQFSYNSGMFITASLELNLVTGTQSYLDDAIKACEFMMNFRNYNGGVFFLNETGQGDGGLFKGIFAKSFIDFVRMGNLSASQRDRYMQVIQYTANYAWNNAVNKSSYLVSPNWSVLPSGTIDLSSHVSGVHLFESVASLKKVHVYQDINYSGYYSQLAVGTYTLAQLQAKGIADNGITSMTVPAGYAVTVYENDNFGGSVKTFTGNASWLADWNDRISSIKIAEVSGPVSVYQDITYGGYAAGLDVGDYSLAQLQAKGILNNDITSLKVAQGFKVTVYDTDNFTGTSAVYTTDTGWLADWNDRIGSLRVRPNGDLTLSGIYELQNRHSNLYMDVSGGPPSTGEGVNVHQWSLTQNTNQQFLLEHVGDGAYKITAMHSGKSLDVNSSGKENGINVQQWSYFGFNNQQFIAVATGDGFHKLIAKHSGRLIEVAGGSTANGGIIQQWENVNQNSGMWKLVRPTPVNGTGDGLNANYFNGRNFETARLTRKDATVNFDWATGSPNALVNADQFSARWTGQVQPRYYGNYTFYLTADDGCRLWVNNQLVVDKWRDDGGTEMSGVIALNAGQKYDIKLEYFENGGGAKAKLEWSSPLQGREVVPTSQLYSTSSARVDTSELSSLREENGVEVYPNPGKIGGVHSITLALGRPSEDVFLSMTDSKGQIILRGEYKVVDSKASVSIPPVRAGLYILRIQNSGHTWVKKYLIE